ncbi:alpha/beta hydrolase family protein [Hugenholtzia roseola]|uniref:alpha/beta hydrolase family protein n=1 Tax=Hugenholtzia roseola TaxID=1002 RepID=UPI00047E98A8|nr:alpha/beta fold hydrolase [Hugenholtzia roseola]
MIQKKEFILTNKTSQRPFAFDLTFSDSLSTQPLLIFLHGFKGFKDWGDFSLLSDLWAQAGFFTLKINFSHNGTTPETPLDFTDLEAFRKNTFAKEIEDIKTVLDFILEKKAYQNYINPDQIALVGHSRGGSTALLYALQDERISKVVTWAAVGDLVGRYFNSAAPDFEAWQKEGVKFVLNGRTGQKLPVGFDLYQDYLYQKEKGNINYDLKKSIADLKIPILLLHGDTDDSVPLTEAQNLQLAQPAAELCIITQASHTFGMQHPSENESLPAAALLAAQKTAIFLKK